MLGIVKTSLKNKLDNLQETASNHPDRDQKQEMNK